MSEVKVNKITPTTNCGTVTLGDSGDTLSIPSGATLSNAGSITNSGTITNTGTISGGTITGTIDNQVNWDTTAKTAGFTAVAGNGYFVNTTSGAITVTLPASPSAGDLVGIKDYANTADTNAITIARNGENIQGTANDFIINTEGAAVTFIYVDGTQGWLTTASSIPADLQDSQYVTATGGTITTCGDYKIHTFTGPGTFCVSNAGNIIGSSTVDYMVVAGGGGGGHRQGGGGGGAGGFRESSGAASGCYTASPLGACVSALPFSVTGYPVTVGAGGVGGFLAGPGTPETDSTPGANSIFSTITSTGGGKGGNTATGPFAPAGPGGSGGGRGTMPTCATGSGGTGNTPPVSPPQGNPGGDGFGPGSFDRGGGGGGAICAGQPGQPPAQGGDGGDGAGTQINPSPSVGDSAIPGTTRFFAGGGGGGGNTTPANGGGDGGGGSSTQPQSPAMIGQINTGGGGAGSAPSGGCTASLRNGGSGIVIIRYKFQN